MLEKGRLGVDWKPGQGELDETTQQGTNALVGFRIASAERRWRVGLDSMVESGDDERCELLSHDKNLELRIESE